MDQIHIHAVDLPTRIGVPYEERAGWQNLQASITLHLRQSFDSLEDDITRTVDYASVVNQVRELAAARPRRLLETLISEMAALLLKEFQPAAVDIELKKRILPGTDYVSVRLSRSH